MKKLKQIKKILIVSLICFFITCNFSTAFQNNKLIPYNNYDVIDTSLLYESRDYFTSIDNTEDGGYIVGGRVSNEELGSHMWIVKFSIDDSIEWDKLYSYLYAPATVRQTRDGGYVIGSSINNDSNSWDYLIIKLDRNGVEEWNTSFGSTDREHTYAAIQTIDNGYILIGTSYDDDDPRYDRSNIYFLKIDEYGNKVWDFLRLGGFEDGGRDVVETKSGDLMFTGYYDHCMFPGHTYLNKSCWINKMRDQGSYGRVLWERKIFQQGEMYSGKAIDLFSDDSAVIAGWKSSTDGLKTLLLKINQDGFLQWEKSYDFSYGKDVKINDDDEIVVLDNDFEIFKTDSNGEFQWVRDFGYNEGIPGELIITSDGNILTCGSTENYYNYGYSDGWIIELDMDGNLIMNNTFGKDSPPPNIEIQSITGGNGITSTISNDGEGPGYDIEWSIKVNVVWGLIFSGNTTQGVIDEINVGEQKTINSSNLKGFGPINITVQVDEIIETKSGFLLGSFVFIKT